jgi:uncharacterized protein
MEIFKNDEVLDLPDISKINFKKIDKSYFNVILINFFLIFIIFLTVIIVLDNYVFSDDIKVYKFFIYLIFTLIFAYAFVHITLAFPKRKYVLRDKDISYKSGLIFYKLTTVPFSRVQHVEIDEKPFSRVFNLASISVYTAGDSSDDLVIKGLPKSEALKIKEFISSKINE